MSSHSTVTAPWNRGAFSASTASLWDWPGSTDASRRTASPGAQRGRAIADEEIRVHLMREDKDALIGLVLEQCERDSEFRDRLVLLAAEKSGDGPDLAEFRAAIGKAMRHSVDENVAVKAPGVHKAQIDPNADFLSLLVAPIHILMGAHCGCPTVLSAISDKRHRSC